jgi:hypothetical protein
MKPKLLSIIEKRKVHEKKGGDLFSHSNQMPESLLRCIPQAGAGSDLVIGN